MPNPLGLSTMAVALLLIAAYVPDAAIAALSPGQFGCRIAASPYPHHRQLYQIRGGAVVDDGEGDSDDYDVDDDEDEIITASANEKLVTSTKTTAQRKKTAAIKSKVKVAMMASSGSTATAAKSASRKSLYKRYVPYIIRACLNPFTLISMTKAYFVSLCDINFLKEEQSQTLRSALEEKARRQQPSSPGGPTKPKRKMKPGQAKTLSDLPQLSA